MDLDGKVVVVTGASSGIGEATARRVAKEGARVVLSARRADRLQALAEQLPSALPVRTDMRQPEQVRQLVASAVEAFGGVDVLVNNAGQGLHVPLLDVAYDDLAAVTELNFYAPLMAIQAVVPVMRDRGGGSIVNVSSGTTLMIPAGTGAYAATKSALNMLSKVSRAELSADGIAVSLVYPFITATEFHESLRAGGGPPRRPGLEPHPPQLVADAIVDLIRSGDEERILVPEGLRSRSS
jgi:NAD(P)-dependent dehydrogenase (short-subunit alcohol dehydrogenase family)